MNPLLQKLIKGAHTSCLLSTRKIFIVSENAVRKIYKDGRLTDTFLTDLDIIIRILTNTCHSTELTSVKSPSGRIERSVSKAAALITPQYFASSNARPNITFAR